jgi:RNA-directed DNA polymerase
VSDEENRNYPLSDSPLFQIRTKKRLAEVLEMDLIELRHLQKLKDSAYVKRFAKPKPGKKPREIQDPEPNLKAIHKRLNKLMQRVIHPEYVQAGLRKRSYLKNAECHPAHNWVCKIDVQSFYPNCKRERVYQFFYKTLECAPDVAELLADLNTVEGHLPTGGPFSMLLSFWSHLDVFETIHARATAIGLKMTLYVDDLTFSGSSARPKFLNDQVKPILITAGLVGHKIKTYAPSKPKHITGVVRTDGGSKVPFDRARKIKSAFEQLHLSIEPSKKLLILNQLISRLCEAATIDNNYAAQAEEMKNCRRTLLDLHPELRRR